ncbi:hypothetical protein GIB67_025147 [Kingdonia uniflora]|uniref:Myosin motor domain-containing protein n=1 Tax=Kingdonia uniflora TaxID=39325 RepID=A0A7J7N864_9MAGN|nr:hypothetical protein GIB67_025147 [Kingdonia uniflora]
MPLFYCAKPEECRDYCEQSRVVQLAKGERSYHIFYQLCAGAPSTLKERLNLKPAGEYNYLKQSGCALIDDIDDAQRFDLLMKTLDSVQIHKEDQDNAFSMISAILWLGNISFEVIDNENHVEVVIDEAVTNSAKLMGCDVQKLSLTLSTRQVQAGPDTIVLPLTYPQISLSDVYFFRQLIQGTSWQSSSMLACLTGWLEKLTSHLEKAADNQGDPLVSSISLGLNHFRQAFRKNGLEQLCVNYANERLQQHFNRHLFKLEQEEYRKNGIDCRQVDFEDNQECLNLFEKKPFGLFSLLDKESSSSSKATDLTLASKLEQHLKANPCFKQETDRNFSVCHYAGKVLYSTSDFLEKNRDPQPSNPIQLLSSCTFQLPQLFASSMFYPLQMPSVGLKFKDQLFKLMQQLEATTPLFIRCIKPNDKKIPGIFDNELVLQQLKCCGVLEFVRISRSSYPTRVTHQQFARRYGFLLQENVKTEDHLSISVAILQKFNVHPYMYQVGYTKLFFRTEQVTTKKEGHRAIDVVGGEDGDVLKNSRSKSHDRTATLMREIHPIDDFDHYEVQPEYNKLRSGVSPICSAATTNRLSRLKNFLIFGIEDIREGTAGTSQTEDTGVVDNSINDIGQSFDVVRLLIGERDRPKSPKARGRESSMGTTNWVSEVVDYTIESFGVVPMANKTIKECFSGRSTPENEGPKLVFGRLSEEELRKRRLTFKSCLAGTSLAGHDLRTDRHA